MEEKIERNIANSLSSIRKAGEELFDPYFDPSDRMVVRELVTKLVQSGTALLAELDEEERQNKELQEESAFVKRQNEAWRAASERRNEPATNWAFVIILVLVISLGVVGYVYMLFSRH